MKVALDLHNCIHDKRLKPVRTYFIEFNIPFHFIT